MRQIFEHVGVATCDGWSLCSELSQHRVKIAGKVNAWYSNYTPECQQALVKEIGRLRYMVSLMPFDRDVARGVTAKGSMYDTWVEGRRPSVIFREKKLREVEESDAAGQSSTQQSEDGDETMGDEALARALEEDLILSDGPTGDDEQVRVVRKSASGEGPATPRRSEETRGRTTTTDMHTWSSVQPIPIAQILKNRDRDPSSGGARPIHLRENCKLFNTANKLAVGYTSPPDVAGGRRIVFWPMSPDKCLGVVEEVTHSLLFTTARVLLTEETRRLCKIKYTTLYINVWSSQNAQKRFRGVLFCQIRYPGDDIDITKFVTELRKEKAAKEKAAENVGGASEPATATGGVRDSATGSREKGSGIPRCFLHTKYSIGNDDGWRTMTSRDKDGEAKVACLPHRGGVPEGGADVRRQVVDPSDGWLHLGPRQNSSRSTPEMSHHAPAHEECHVVVGQPEGVADEGFDGEGHSDPRCHCQRDGSALGTLLAAGRNTVV